MIDKYPAWLQKLIDLKPEQQTAIGWTAQDIEAAKSEHMMDADYRQKTQEVSKLRKIMEANPDLDPEAAIAELNQWRGWRQDKWPAIQQEMAEAERLKGELADLKKASPNGTVPVVDGTWGVTAEDFYETNRLWGALGKLEGRFTDKAVAATKDWYTKEVTPNIENLAAQYLGSVMGPVGLLWEKLIEAKLMPAVPLEDVFKEIAVQGADKRVKFKDVYGGIATKGTETKTAGYDEGYKKAKEDLAAEAAKVGTSAVPPNERSGPAGGNLPKWTPPPAGTKMTREDRMNSVISEVTTRKGPLPL
jgi:hypothetical protein